MGFVDDYAPFILARNSFEAQEEFNIPLGKEYDYLKETFIKAGCKSASDMSEDEYISFLMSDAFLNIKEEEHKDLNLYLIDRLAPLIQNITAFDEKMYEGKNARNILAECQDLFGFPVFLSKWIRNKQVYKLDKDFAIALMSTETCEITRDMINHLPCQNIYIDMADLEDFKPIDGFLLNVIPNDKGVQFAIYLLQKMIDYSTGKKDITFFSFYIGGEYDENNIIKLDIQKITDYNADGDFSIFPFLHKNNGDFKFNRAQMSVLGIQILAYLSSKDPQIEENPVTKKTYKKPNDNFIKNKFSEIQMWDIGVKYGNSYRNTMKQLNAGNRGFTLDYKRKSPIPHFRRAHWQRFWVGKGRTQVINKWIAPTFVNGEMAKDININLLKEN